ncbi:T9SS type A sorting domain-containing protein [uncultured Arcticibacterium sp.]|uniref:T9SS type A sorting domain-containing protein n=1 Tax=uncultured Arcticibacterium sp. TaxID=2173042 RepID=UPI0030FB05F0
MVSYKCLLTALVLSISSNVLSQTYSITSQHSFGGDEDDAANDLIKTSDNGIIMVGSTHSKNSFDVGASNGARGNGGSDFWVVKLNQSGSLIWSKTFGGSEDDEATSIAKTLNGEYVIVGSTKSTNGDANYNGTNGGILMIRIKEDGSLVSTRIIPGGRRFTEDTYHYADTFSKPAVAVSKDGFIYIGGTHEIGSSPYKAKQFYLTKLTPTGDTLWQKFFGSDFDEQFSNLEIASNGDIQMVGSTTSNATQIAGAGNGNLDFFAVRTDKNGNVLWQKAWGGNNIDALHGLVENHQKTGFVLVGETSSNQGSINSNFGNKDAFLFEIDTNGNLRWKTPYGGESNDNLYDIVYSGSSNYLALGTSDSRLAGVTSKGPLTDILTLTISSSGQIINAGQYGGEDLDVGRGGIALSEETWAIAGISRSSSEDVSKNNGENDFWLLMLGEPTPIEITDFRGFRNLDNQGELSWRTNYEFSAKSIVVEKSADNTSFIPLQTFSISGNSSSRKNYNYLDPQLRLGANYYRLKYYGTNGKTYLGPSLLIQNTPLALAPEKTVVSLYPNPSTQKAILSVFDPQASITVFNIAGISQKTENSYSNEEGWKLNIQNLNPGTYIIKVITKEQSLTKRFIKK